MKAVVLSACGDVTKLDLEDLPDPRIGRDASGEVVAVGSAVPSLPPGVTGIASHR